jgi:hypothetical protein
MAKQTFRRHSSGDDHYRVLYFYLLPQEVKMQSALTPNPDLDYNFLTAIYSIGFVTGVTLYALEKTVYQDSKFLADSYIIFLPFAPCLIWSTIVRHRWLREISVLSNTKHEKSS